MQIIDKNGNVILEKNMPRKIFAKNGTARLLWSSHNSISKPVIMRKEDFNGGLF